MIHIIPLVNFLVCMLGVWICIIERFRVMDIITTKNPIRWQYFVRAVAFLISGLSFGYDFPANAIQLFMGSLLLVELFIGNPAWRHGQPDHAKKIVADSV
jgi:hypothetical protein